MFRNMRGMTQERIAASLDVMPELLIQSEMPNPTMSALLNGCTAAEQQVILDVAQTVKESLRRHPLR